MGTGKARDNEADLAALLKEVRDLRREIEVLKANPAIARAVTQPEDELLVSAERDLPPGYAVAVRAAKLPPNYAVAVRSAGLPPDYAVAVRSLPTLPEEPIATKSAAKKGAAKKSAPAKKR